MGLSNKKDLMLVNSAFDNGFAQGKIYGAALKSNLPEHWLSVDRDGQPSTGLYPALFQDCGNLIVSMLNYGDYEDYDGDSRTGWAELPRNDDEDYIPRKVVAYLPINFDIGSLIGVRSHFLRNSNA